MSSDSLLLGIGDMFECVALHGDDGPDLPLVRRDLVKLLVQLELEVHRSQLDDLVEYG